MTVLWWWHFVLRLMTSLWWWHFVLMTHDVFIAGQFYIVVILMVSMGVILSIITINIAQAKRRMPICLEKVCIKEKFIIIHDICFSNLSNHSGSRSHVVTKIYSGSCVIAKLILHTGCGSLSGPILKACFILTSFFSSSVRLYSTSLLYKDINRSTNQPSKNF